MQSIVPVNSAIRRGCGYRVQGGLYACVSPVPEGAPLESFIVDPAFPWTQGPFQGCQFFTRSDGTVDLIMWIGEQYYPYAPDFLEEARIHGVSKRIPVRRGDGYQRLTPGESRLILVHPKGIVKNAYRLQPRAGGTLPRVERDVDSGECNHPTHHRRGTTPCTYALWDLSARDECHTEDFHAVLPDNALVATIECPSVTFSVTRPSPQMPPGPLAYEPGVVAMFTLSHFEFVNEHQNQMPQFVAGVLGDNLQHTLVTAT